jgi:hypothetical protein
VLDQNILAVHPQFALKQDFESSIQNATAAMTDEISKVSADTSLHPTLHDIVKKAARLWVEIGMQWYVPLESTVY